MPHALQPQGEHSDTPDPGEGAANGRAGPRTYRMGRGMVALLVTATLGFLGAAVAVAGVEGALAGRILVAGLSCALAGLGIAALLQSRRYRVTIYEEGMELVRWRRTLRMSADQILGYRRVQGRGSAMLVLVPRDPKAKPFPVPVWFRPDPTFEAWLKRFPELGARERERSEAALLASPALGATPTARRAHLARARVIAHLLNWPAVGVGLWAFLFPRPFALAVAVALLYPLLALAVAILGRGVYQLLGRREDARPALSLAFLLPWFGVLLPALRFELATPGALILPAVGVGAILTALFFLGDAAIRRRPAWAILFMPLLTAPGAAGIAAANCLLDASAPRVHEVRIVDRYETSGRGAARWLKLAPWGPRSEPDRLMVPRSLYDAASVGALLRLHLYQGRLGLAWFEADAVVDPARQAQARRSRTAAGWIHGRVVRRNGVGELDPVAEVTLSSPAFRTIRLDSADGRFEVEASRLWVRAPLLVSAPGLAPTAMRFDLTEPGELDVGDILLGPGRTVRGTIRDVAGLPVEGAQIRIGYASGALDEPAACSDASGAFELASVSQDDAALVVLHPRFRRQEVVARSGAAVLDVQLTQGVSLPVVVEDDAGRPIADAQVRDVRSHERCKTGALGECTLAGLGEQEQLLEAQLRGRQGPTTPQLRVPFSTARGAPVPVRVARRPWTLRVVATELDGSPAGATFAVIPEEVASGSVLAPDGEIDHPHYSGGSAGTFQDLPVRPSTVVVRSLVGGSRCAIRTFRPADAAEQVLTVALPASAGPCRP